MTLDLSPIFFEFANIKNLGLYILGSYVSLISVINPLAAVPIFTTMTEGWANDERIQVARKTSAYVLGILTTFFLAGSFILSFFGISIDALRIAGGLMILLTALDRLNKKDKLTDEEKAEVLDKDEIAFSPLAMPFMSGPGAIAVLLGMTGDIESTLYYFSVLLTILLVAATCYLTLRVAPVLSERLGRTLLRALGRIMGFILLCIGVQFLINGVLGLR